MTTPAQAQIEVDGVLHNLDTFPLEIQHMVAACNRAQSELAELSYQISRQRAFINELSTKTHKLIVEFQTVAHLIAAQDVPAWSPAVPAEIAE